MRDKMQESELLRIALIVAASGLIALFIISATTELEVTNTYDVGRTGINRDVRIIGQIISVKELDKILLLEVSQQKQVTVVVFKDGKGRNFSAGEEVDITGQVRDYKGKMEVVAEKVKTK